MTTTPTDERARWLTQRLIDLPMQEIDEAFTYVTGFTILEAGKNLRKNVKGILYKKNLPQQDFEDIAQKALLVILNRTQHIRPDKPDAYLMIAAKNAVLHQMEYDHQAIRDIRKVSGTEVPDIPDASQSPVEDQAFSSEVIEILQAEIATWPTDLRSVMNATWDLSSGDINAMSGKDAAQLLGMSEGKVRRLRSQGKDRVLAFLIEHGNNINVNEDKK